MIKDGGGSPARKQKMMADYAAETRGINLYAERSLHAQIKKFYWESGDRFEAKVDGKIVDILKGNGEVIEVQTRGIGKIQAKALALSRSGHSVRIVYPLAVEREIRRLDPATDELVSIRRSPKRGTMYELFAELVHAPGLIAAKNITIDVLLVKTAETRKNDGTGSWRRRGDRTIDSELVEVRGSRSFRTASQWLSFIPRQLSPPWSSMALASALGIPTERARQLLYCFAKAGLVSEVGRRGRTKLYERTKSTWRPRKTSVFRGQP